MTDLSAAPRPTVAPPSPWDFPVPQERLLPGGIRLLQHHLPGQHVLSVRVVIPVSLTDEPRDREGVASLMARLLDEGAGDYSSDELAEVLERHGIALGAGVAEGGLSVDLDVPSRFLPTALELLSLIVREPTFPEAEVRRMVKTRLAEIDQESASPPHLAMRHTIATLYAPHERASRPSAGGAATVAQLTRDDVEGWFRARVGPAGATFIVAGDLGEHDVPGLVEAAFASWVAPGHVAPSPARRPELARTAARVVLVDRPGSVQSEIVVACQGPDRSVEPGWAEYPVLAFILGGSPNARIDAVLRERRATRTAFAPASVLDPQAGCSSPVGRCAPRSRPSRCRSCWACSTGCGRVSARPRSRLLSISSHGPRLGVLPRPMRSRTRPRRWPSNVCLWTFRRPTCGAWSP